MDSKRYDGIWVKAAEIGKLHQARRVGWVQRDEKNNAAHAAPLLRRDAPNAATVNQTHAVAGSEP